MGGYMKDPKKIEVLGWYPSIPPISASAIYILLVVIAEVIGIMVGYDQWSYEIATALLVAQWLAAEAGIHVEKG